MFQNPDQHEYHRGARAEYANASSKDQIKADLDALLNAPVDKLFTSPVKKPRNNLNSPLRTSSPMRDEITNFEVDHQSSTIIHTVVPTDTLLGLSLLYHVTAQQIKSENGLWSDNDLFSRKTIRIPKGEDEILEIIEARKEAAKIKEEENEYKVQQLQEETNLSYEDAYSLLSQNQFHLERALEKHQIGIANIANSSFNSKKNTNPYNLPLPEKLELKPAEQQRRSDDPFPEYTLSRQAKKTYFDEETPISLHTNKYYSYNSSSSANRIAVNKEKKSLFDFL
eukprot:TRINITY_DN3717_c0_g1_i2.p1 TRINITY_DN3717_c0_g1~~TRINITY_DN3717_c0_g1_i2.p1  ORF type:complete len:282 (-),score=61.86 TRINITY_DN3717_c0_g1_i2:94-939(-)